MGFVIKYQTLFDLAVWHHHFLDSPSAGVFTPPPGGGTPADIVQRLLDYDVRKVVEVRLSPDSEKTLQSRGLTFKPSRRGCLVASRDTFVETDPAVKLTLLLLLRDPAFWNYSDFSAPVTMAQKVFYLSNRNTAGVPGILVDNDATLTLDDANQERWSPRLVRLPKTNPASTGATIAVFEHTSPAPGPALTLTVTSPAGQPEFEVDCRSLPEGLYRFESPGQIATVRRFLGLESTGGLFGIAEIFLNALADAHYHVGIDRL